MKYAALGIFVAVTIAGTVIFYKYKSEEITAENPLVKVDQVIDVIQHPLEIEYMRGQSYPGSDIVIEDELPAGSNYDRYLASYQSEGLKIYALLTVPQGEVPEGGWPVVVFNHGYIPPAQYRTTERYTAYTDAFPEMAMYYSDRITAATATRKVSLRAPTTHPATQLTC